MNTAFYVSGAIAILATVLAITRREVIHGLLYLVVSLLAVAVAFLVLGAPFAAALQVITYAGAMMVMLLFAIMTLIPRTGKKGGATRSPRPWSWLGPAVLTLLLMVDFIYVLSAGEPSPVPGTAVSPARVGFALFGPYALGVELASMLLLAGLVGAYHLGRHSSTNKDS